MNLIDDPNIVTPNIITPVYHQQGGQFRFQVSIKNLHPHLIHIYVASTFGYCLSERTNIKRIEPNTAVELKFELKMTNLIGGGMEAIAIYASNHKIFEEFPINIGSLKFIKLNFNEQINMDPTILEILSSQINNSLQISQNYKANGDLEKALNKCQQAYQIMRTSQKALNALIQCRLLLKDFKRAILDIESRLIHSRGSPHYLLQKIKIITQWQQSAISQNEELFHYIKTTLDYITDNQLLLLISDLTILNNLKDEFKQYAKNTKGKPNKQAQYLIDKAIDQYNQGLPITNFYSKMELEEQLKTMFVEPQPEDLGTPQLALDPINYQIMKKPYILPSGNSVQQKSLQKYFMSNGYKDPISRQPLQPDLVFPNNALQRFINQHPQRPQWERYEYDFINN